MLFQMFARLSLDDKVKALQQKIVAVAWLANITLYGAVGEAAKQQAEESGHRVIASISPSDYRHVVRRVLGRELLRKATFGLRQKLPHFSARERVTTAQVLMLILFSFGLAGSFWIWPSPVIYLFLSLICGLLFLSIIGLRILCLDHRLITPRTMFPKLSEDDLPIYTILVPVFREVNVLKQLIGALKSLNYPKSKLDIKLILEETDIAMQRAVSKIDLPDFIEIIVVPAGKPQTKPRALNYALQFARGTLVAIYDAEDIPEPDQLQKAAAKFANGARNLACVQAELTFYNPNENWLTRGIMAQTPQAV